MSNKYENWMRDDTSVHKDRRGWVLRLLPPIWCIWLTRTFGPLKIEDTVTSDRNWYFQPMRIFTYLITIHSCDVFHFHGKPLSLSGPSQLIFALFGVHSQPAQGTMTPLISFGRSYVNFTMINNKQMHFVVVDLWYCFVSYCRSSIFSFEGT